MIDVNKAMYNQGRLDALETQKKASNLTGTQLYENAETIPDFQSVLKNKNMNERPTGFVCRSTAGRMIRLATPYDSTAQNQEPEELSANWDFAWSSNPQDALPFIETDHSPYNTGDCCTVNDEVYRSTEDGNKVNPTSKPGAAEEISLLDLTDENTLAPGWEKI